MRIGKSSTSVVAIGPKRAVAATTKRSGWPLANIATAGQVMVGALSTVRTKLWLASGAIPLRAVMVIG